MSRTELLILSVGLAMDAFSASVCQGVKNRNSQLKTAVITALFFGAFQAVMPLFGYFAGTNFTSTVSRYKGWIALVLLGIIGGKMIYEAFSGGDEETEVKGGAVSIKELSVLAVATSIDALAVGVLFVGQSISILSSVLTIGIVTFLLSFAGVYAGGLAGMRYGKNAEICGGIVLVFIGLKIFFS